MKTTKNQHNPQGGESFTNQYQGSSMKQRNLTIVFNFKLKISLLASVQRSSLTLDPTNETLQVDQHRHFEPNTPTLRLDDPDTIEQNVPDVIITFSLPLGKPCWLCPHSENLV